jgi:hypothetical protein
MHFVRYPSDSVASPSINAWHHVALTRASATFKAFVDGSLVATDAGYTPTVHGSLLVNGLAGAFDNGDFKGYVDELRVVKGTAVWTDNFTPPTTPYPDGSGGTADGGV